MSTDISGNGATQAIYLEMSGVNIRWSKSDAPTNFFTISSWPVTITNTNPGASSILRVIATNNLNITSSTGGVSGYFTANTAFITFDGSGNTITIDGITSYPGFIQNGTSGVNGKANVIVQNFTTAVANLSTLASLAGWLCQSYFSSGVTGNTITNCTNNGAVNGTACGGIVGFRAGYNSGSISITNCTNTGEISEAQSGGIVGQDAGGSDGQITITKCVNRGSITGGGSGGITGQAFATDSNNICIISQCYNIGSITNGYCGGIVGQYAGINSGTYVPRIDISSCYSIGPIYINSGGIIARDGFTYTNAPIVNITNCYGFDNVTPANSCIFSASAPYTKGTLSFCYTPTTGWSDASANAALAGTPTSLTSNNPGTTWAKVLAGTTGNPYLLSAYNAAIYNPSSVVTGGRFYTTSPGLFQSDYNYQLLYIMNSVYSATTQVFVSKGTSPYGYHSYNFNSFTITSVSGGVGQIRLSSINASSGVLDFTLPEAPCFLEGTKILCFENNQEVYRAVESLRKGDLVKTIYNGYMPVCMMGTTSIYNPGNDYRIANRLYKCPKEKYPTLFEDLYITGCHSILVPSMSDDEWEITKAVNGNVYVTDNHFRLLACADENAEPFNKEGFMNIYHIALEHNDICMNYGIYANGLLVESCSIDYLIQYSNLKIMGEEDCSVYQDVDKVPNNMCRPLVETY